MTPNFISTSEMLSLESNGVSFNENDEISPSPETPEPSFFYHHKQQSVKYFFFRHQKGSPVVENESTTLTSLSSLNIESEYIIFLIHPRPTL